MKKKSLYLSTLTLHFFNHALPPTTNQHTHTNTHTHTHTTQVLTWAYISVSVPISVFWKLGHSMRIVVGLTANFLKRTKICFNISLVFYIAKQMLSQSV